MHKGKLWSLLLLTILMCSTFLSLSSIPEAKAAEATGSLVQSTANRGFQFQGQVFYAQGYYWQFYYNGSHGVYETSSDGTTWSGSLTAIAAIGNAGRQATFWNGTYIYYAYNTGNVAKFQRGNITGTSITWGATKTLTAHETTTEWVCVTSDSSGHPFVGSYYDGTYKTYSVQYSMDSTDGSGTWAELIVANHDGASNSQVMGNLVQLELGQVYLTWSYPAARADKEYYGALWSGSAWGSTETITSGGSKPNFGTFTISGVGGTYAGDVFVFWQRANNEFATRRRFSNGTFNTAYTIATGTGAIHIGGCYNIYSDDLYFLWYNSSNHVYYNQFRMSNQTWQSAVDFLSETVDTLPAQGIACSLASDAKFVFSYMTKATAPFNLKLTVKTLDSISYTTIGVTAKETLESTIFYSYWYAMGLGSLSGYILSVNFGAGYANETWAAFPDSNSTWANITLTISAPLGTTVLWKVYVNNSLNNWRTTLEQNFIAEATLTFKFNTGGALVVNSTSIANSTTITYSQVTVLILSGAAAVNYTFQNFTAYSSVVWTTNPLTFNVANRTTVWCYFAAGGTGGNGTTIYVPEYIEEGLELLVLPIGIIFGFLIIVVSLRRKNKRSSEEGRVIMPEEY